MSIEGGGRGSTLLSINAGVKGLQIISFILHLTEFRIQRNSVHTEFRIFGIPRNTEFRKKFTEFRNLIPAEFQKIT